jgi:hypothetical protein
VSILLDNLGIILLRYYIMESDLLAMLGVGALTRLTLCLYSENKKRRMLTRLRQRAGHVCALVMPKKSGKTRLSSNLKSVEGKVKTLIVDLNEVVESKLKDDDAGNENNRTVRYYPVAKKYVDSLKADFPKHRLLVLCDDYDLTQHLGIVDVVCYIPRMDLHSQLVARIDDEAERKLCERNYISLLQSGCPILRYFDDFKTLTGEVRERYALSLTV